MSITERDTILRAIQQLGESLARIAGLRRSGKAEAALLDVQQAVGSILGPMADMVEQLDPSSAVMLLSDPRKIRAYGLLLAERSSIRHALGQDAAAQRDRLRALEVISHWLKRTGALDDEVRAALESMRNA